MLISPSRAFVTEHDDDVAGKQRLAAYVFGFTPQWRPDWGGVLQFIDSNGHIPKATHRNSMC